MGERREFVRINKRITVQYKEVIEWFASTAARPNITDTQTLSANGMLMLLSKPIEKGKKLDITLEVPDGKPAIDIGGEVLGHNDQGGNRFEIKVKFAEMEDADRDRLAAYVIREDVRAKKEGK